MRKLFLYLLLGAAIASNAAYFLLKSDLVKQAQEEEAPSSIADKKPAIEPPPLETLGQGARPPTLEELADEAHYDDTQVAKAQEWINSPEAGKRIAGAEQLSAFPTHQSEQLLINTMLSDSDPEVRKTAAQSLAAFPEPSESVVSALLAALEDDNGKVQIGAFNTLQPIADKFERDSPVMKNMLARMKKIASSRRIKPLTRKALHSFLQDQQPPAHPTNSP